MQPSRRPRGRPYRTGASQRPAWDDTLHDLSQMRLTPAEQLQRRAQRVSKHNLLGRHVLQHGHDMTGDGSQRQSPACGMYQHAEDSPSSSRPSSSSSSEGRHVAAPAITSAAGADHAADLDSPASSTCSSPRSHHDCQLPKHHVHNHRYVDTHASQQYPENGQGAVQVQALQQQVLDLSRHLAAATWQLQRTQQQLDQLQRAQAQGHAEPPGAARQSPSRPQQGSTAAGGAGWTQTPSSAAAAATQETAGGEGGSSASAADPMLQRMQLLMPLEPDAARAAVSDQRGRGGPASKQQLQQQVAPSSGGSPRAVVPAAPDALELPRFAEVRRQAVGLALGGTTTAATPAWSTSAGARGCGVPDALMELLEDMKAGPWEQLLQQQQPAGHVTIPVSPSRPVQTYHGRHEAAVAGAGAATGPPKGAAGWVCSDVPPAPSPGSGWRPGDDVGEPVGDQNTAVLGSWQQLEGMLPGPGDVDRGFDAGMVRAAVGRVQALAAGYHSSAGGAGGARGKVHPGQLAGSMSFRQHVEGGGVLAGADAATAAAVGAGSMQLWSG